MIDLTTILAKSQHNGSLTLLDHTKHVVQAIRLFATRYSFPFNIETAVHGAILHDLGKAHPNFQKRIEGSNAVTLKEQQETDEVHRHELSSLAFLPCFPKSEWNDLIELVVAHHKSIEKDPKNRGILDLENRLRNWKDYHLKNWDTWAEYGYEVLKHFNLAVEKPSKNEALNAIEYAVDFCLDIDYGWSPLRGLLKSADHFASAFMHQTETQLQTLFERPDFSFYEDARRKSSLFPLSLISTNTTQKHTLVVAPTGAGKTDFLLRRCEGRLFYTLPFQASINAMYQRIKETVPQQDIRLLHATSKVVIGKEIEEQILQPMPGSSVKILTPHQLAAIVFGTKGYETMMLDLEGCDIILDEIHTYSGVSQSMVLEIVKALLRINCRVHIGTATMPSLLYNTLLKILGEKEAVYEVSLPNNVLDKFDRHTVHKMPNPDAIPDILEHAFEGKEKVLLIYNTVKKAQGAFEHYDELFPDIKKMLIHSRFRRKDRVRLENSLQSDFNGNKKNPNGTAPCLVISTQVVEVSLDISFDRMITECAPLDSLIQRFGRINRKRTKNTIGKCKPVHVIEPKDNVLPYKMAVLKASYDCLPDNGGALKTRDLQAKIDSVFPDFQPLPIDLHLIFNNGEYDILKLTDRPKALLIDILEIESATCILECDREDYLNSDYHERIELEIPISFRAINRFKNHYEQLAMGSNPFVVPQKEATHLTMGLQLVEHDLFI